VYAYSYICVRILSGKLRGVLDASVGDQDGFACSVMTYKHIRDAKAFTASVASALALMRSVLDASTWRPDNEKK
jgi:hypothetical protein